MSPGQSPPACRSPLVRGDSATPPTTSSALVHARDEDQAHDRLEPDETTGIVMKGPNRGASSAMNYQSTVTAESNGARPRRNGSTLRSNTGRRRDTATATSRADASNDDRDRDRDQDQDQDQNKEAMAWWKAQLAKFASIELENKGSVARDHLALGGLVSAEQETAVMLTRRPCCRTDVSRLAADVAFFCLDWHRHHATLPPQHLAYQGGQCKRAHAAASREAARCDFPGHQHFDALPGLPQVFPGPAVDHQGEIPRKQRHRYIGVACGTGPDDNISVR